MGVTVSVECLKNVIVSDSSCCSQHDHEAFTGIRVTIGLKRYYFRPYSILLYKKGQITIRDIENSVSFKEADSNQTFTQIRSLIANCAACGCNAVPVLLTSPNNTINIKTLPTGVTEIETDLSNLASTDAGNRLVQGSDTLWYVPPVTWSLISGAQNVVNVGDFNNNVGYLTSVGWSDLTGAQNVIDLSGFNNDIGFITGVTWAQITGSQGGINLSLFNNDANFISVGDNISDLNNDLNFISVGDDISLLNNNAGYVDAAGAAAAAPIQTVTGPVVDNTDPANPVINSELPSSPDNGDLAQFNGTNWVARSIVEILQEVPLSARIALDIEDGFVMRVDTSVQGTGTVSATDQIQLTGAEGEYTAEAYHNDVLVDTFPNLTGEQTLTLPSAGIYDIRILPTGGTPFHTIQYNNSGDRQKVKRIRCFGNEVVWSSFNVAFYGCDISSIDGIVKNGVNVTEFTLCFRDNNLTTLPEGLFDNCPNVTTFRFCFQNNALTTIPSGIFDNCLNVTDFRSCFRGNNLSTLPTGLFDNCPNVTIFRDCFLSNNLTAIPTGLFDNCTNVTDFRSCFRGNNLSTLPTGLFDNCPNVTDFEDCFFSNTLTVAALSRLYIEIEATNANSNVPFHGGSGQYDPTFTAPPFPNNTGTARADLVARGWILTDGGSI